MAKKNRCSETYCSNVERAVGIWQLRQQNGLSPNGGRFIEFRTCCQWSDAFLMGDEEGLIAHKCSMEHIANLIGVCPVDMEEFHRDPYNWKLLKEMQRRQV